MLALIQSEDPKDIRIVYRHFPLISIHDKAALSAQAADAAGLQGKFWEMHDLLFARQQEWGELTVEQFQEWLQARAGELGLDKERFRTDMLNPELAAKVQAAWDRVFYIFIVSLPSRPFRPAFQNPPVQQVANHLFDK